MTIEHTSSDLSRRRLLGYAAALGAGAAVAAMPGVTRAAGRPAARAAGGTYDGPDVSLNFWNGFTGGDGPFMQTMVDQFNEEHPNIQVTMTVSEWADFYAKMPSAVTTGNGPEVAVVHVDQVATNAARNVVLNLDDLASDLGLAADDFPEAVWNAGIFREARFAIPLDIHPLGFYANSGQLSTAGVSALPTDAASFEEAIALLQDPGGVAAPFWMSATWPAHLIFISLLSQFGGTLYDAEGAASTFNSDAGVAALEWMRSAIDDGASPSDVSNDSQAQAFRQQENSLTWDGIWMMNEWAKIDGLEWEAGPLPTIGDAPAVWASSHQMVVTSQAGGDENKLAASSAFVSWLSENSIEWAKSGQIPARNSVRESPEFAELTVQSSLAEQLDHVVFPPTVPGIGDVTAPSFELAVNEVILGQSSPADALAKAAEVADAMLADNRSRYGE